MTTTRFTRFMPTQPILGADLNLILSALDGGSFTTQGSPVVSGSTSATGGGPVVIGGGGGTNTPSIPTGLGGSGGIDTVSQANNGYATISWNANPASEFVMEYDIQYRKGSDSQIYLSKVGGGVTSVKIPNLFPGSVYMFSIRAVNGAGYYSLWSAEVGVSISVDITPPDVPTGLAAFSATKGVYLTWNAVSGANSADLMGYDLAISTDGGVTFPTVQQLGPGVSYFYSYDSLNPSNNQAALQFKVRSRDWSSNTSAYTSAASATVGGLAFDEITVGNLLALGTISATGGLQTASSGQRTVIDNTGLRTFNAGGTETARLAAATGSMVLSGNLTVTGTITGGTIVGATLETSATVLTTGGFLADSSGMRVVANVNTYVPTGTTTWFANSNGQFLSASNWPLCWGYQPVDSTYKTRNRFWLTTDVTVIFKTYLVFSLQPFHSGNQTTAVGSTSSTTSANHTHNISTTTTDSQAHGHSVSMSVIGAGSFAGTNYVTVDPSHNYLSSTYTSDVTITNPTTDAPGHSHGVFAPTSAGQSADHTHTIPSLSLNAPNQLVESGMAQGVHVFVDGVDRTVALGGPWGVGAAIDVGPLDISAYITTTGWHEINLSSTALGGITVTIYTKTIIQAI